MPLHVDELLAALESAAAPEASAEGQALHRLGRVRSVTEEATTGLSRVRGAVQGERHRPYAVSLTVRAEGADGRCDCEGPRQPCPHVVALARAWAASHRSGRTGAETPWRWVLEALAPAAGPAPGRDVLVHWIDLLRRWPGPWALVVSWRVHRVGGRGIGGGRLLSLTRPDGHELPPCAVEADERVLALALGAGAQPVAGRPGSVEVAPGRVDPVLRALSRAPWVRWVGTRAPAICDLRPAVPSLSAADLGRELRVSLQWSEPALAAGPLRVIGSAPPWVEVGGQLRPVDGVDDGGALAALGEGPVSIPEADLPAFLGTALPALEERGIAVEIGGLEGRRLLVEETARPRLYLTEEGRLLVADLRFAYGDYEVAAENPAPVLTLGPGEVRTLLRRDMEAEFQAASRLRDLGFRMAEPGRFEADGDAAFDFLLESLEPLSREWEVFGRDRLRRHRVTASSAALSARLSAGIDWLDLQLEARVGDEGVPLEEVLRAFRRGSRYVRLEGGTHARVAREWLERVASGLDELGVERGRSQLAPSLAPLVEEFLGGVERVEISGQEAWARLTEGLREQGSVPVLALPSGLVGVLRPYQERGYHWLRFLGEVGLGGILADDMGLGKTIQTLTLLLSEVEGGREGPSLVVAPTSVVPNWAAEARRFAPGLRVLRYHGLERKELLAGIGESHLVLTSYAVLRRDLRELGAVDWNYAILDEAQAIKNAATQTARAARRLRARRRLTLTGTPLENHLGELWSQFQFLMPGLLGSERRFAERYARPAAQGDDGARARLRHRIRPFVLRRLKGEVASELPEKVESVLFCQMGPEQERLYQSLLAASRERVFREVETRGLARSRLCILDALLRLRQACCHPAVLPGDLGRDIPSAKFDLFCDFVSEVVEEGHRVLVFSQFVRVLEVLRRWFEQAGISHLYLDGRTRDREERVRRFQEDESVAAFLVSLKAGGTGLNLTGADYVVLYDPWWNPAVELQATDRAHRLGQTRKVFAYKLITQGTVEEKILALQDRKRGLTDDVLRTESQWGGELTVDDVEELFRP
ncbi:MAG: SNF2 helicase associated domain-containing protein [Deltaproteobacteria bacterium]|nr:SNF2 helicase associated domain-containing protein [Deltaproteobacteria bacterium]